MAQPASVQAEVQRNILSTGAARHQISHPVEMRRGDLRSVTLTIPLLEKGAFLVVKLPIPIVQEVVRQSRELPESERSQFVREWIMRNQQAVLEQYVQSGRGQKRFRYDVIPSLAPSVTESTPKRVREPYPPKTAPRVIQPEEKPEQKKPEEAPKAPPRVIQPEIPAPKQESPKERPVPIETKRELPPFPSQIKSGNGTSAKPFEVYLSRSEVEREGKRERKTESEAIIVVPLNLDIEGLGSLRFRIAFKARQITKSARSATQSELWSILRQSADRVAAERNIRVDNTAFRTAQQGYFKSFPSMMDQIERTDEDLGRYLREN
jgi:hypothetical protein